jgi:hypothetical protein
MRGPVDVPIERVLEVDLAGIAQLHDRRGRERLRDRADPVLRVRCRLDSRLEVRRADGRLPDQLAVAQNGRCEARQALLALLFPDELIELRRQRLRRGQRALPA